MLRKTILSLSICLVAMGVATLGFAGIPDLDTSSCEMTNAPAGVNINVSNVPDGSGYLMTEARQIGTLPGTWEDATITVTLLDSESNPVFLYPFEDIWLENPPAIPDDPMDQYDTPGLVACPNGTIADASTDINGVTTFSGPFYAGGHVDYTKNGDDSDDGKTYVMISGEPLTSGPLQLLFNSPDINGDGVWNTDADVVVFSTWFPPDPLDPPLFNYNYGVDFYFDEVNDISDLVLFSAAQNVSCP